MPHGRSPTHSIIFGSSTLLWLSSVCCNECNSRHKNMLYFGHLSGRLFLNEISRLIQVIQGRNKLPLYSNGEGKSRQSSEGV